MARPLRYRVDFAMKTRSTPPQPAPTDAEQAAIDRQYGLEPVFEPDALQTDQAAPGARFCVVQCPYCGENFETLVDLSAGSSTYIEDCQVCCQPIEFNLQVDVDDQLQSLNTRRTD
jgi:hypothetical protein